MCLLHSERADLRATACPPTRFRRLSRGRLDGQAARNDRQRGARGRGTR
jgi:hypothetical protein